MSWAFEATPAGVEALHQSVAEIPEIQRSLLANDPHIGRLDRAAHQQQIAAGKVTLQIAGELPPELDGVGIFVPGSEALGIGRISTGLGCPHLETDPDFLGLMLAFQTAQGDRVDFLAINDQGAPTDTVEEFVSLLAATAAAAGTSIPFGDVGELHLGNLSAAQAKLFAALKTRLGFVRATQLYLHVARQTARTALSTSAIQQYWTGVVEASGTPGKFTFVPPAELNSHRGLLAGERHLSDDWARHCAGGDIGFVVRWVRYRSEDETPLERLTRGWDESHAVTVGSVTFGRMNPASQEGRLLAVLAAEMGANPGHWVGTRPGEPRPEFPATRFTAARQVAYALSQATREALPDAAYRDFFTTGVIDPGLERELLRRPAAHRVFANASSDSAPALGFQVSE